MRVSQWLAPDGPIAAYLSAFEPRDEQLRMATAVAEAFADPHHLVVEAGTGVGKTFAYLLPAIDLVTQQPGRRVVISTHTIALQEQIVHKDLPLLREALGVAFSVELVKGRNNYLGLRRLKNASERQKSLFARGEQLRVLHAIEDWAYTTKDGSRSDLPEPVPADVWEKVRSEHGNCLGRRCPSYEPCFFQRARRRAEQAQLLIVNHALLMADLVLRPQGVSVLPDYDYVVLDEAHMLDRVATDQLGTHIASSEVQYLLSGLFNDRTGKGFLAAMGTDDQRRAVVAAAAAATEFFNALFAWQRQHGRSNGRLVRADVVPNPLSPALRVMNATLAPLARQLQRPEDRQELEAYIERAEGVATAVDDLLGQKLASHVYWVDLDERRGRRIGLAAAPLEPGPVLRELLFDRIDSVVMTSATLAVAGDESFSYLLGQMGSPPAQTLRLGSPYDYAQQVTVHVEAGMPQPSDGRFVEAATRATCRYLRASAGRAFVLCTSYAMLAELARGIRAELSGEDYTVIAQGEDLPRSMMLERFRQTPRAVILGTDSFWQGIDVAGEALSNVTIVKLPFAVPDRPTIEARIEEIRNRGGNPFMEFQLPEAILKFRQGFGRLIRSHQDRGIVVVLDPRVVTKHYGRQFLASLPSCKVEISRQPW